MNNMLFTHEKHYKAFWGYPGVKRIDLEIFEGEICALVGEMARANPLWRKNHCRGVHAYDSGSLEFQAAPVVFHNTNEAVQAGIAIVLQEFNLIPHLSIAENIFLTHREAYREDFTNRRAIRQYTHKLFHQIGWELEVNPDRKVSDLTVAEKQIVEIIKAISLNARLLT